MPYFREIREADKSLMENLSINPAMRMTKKGDSFSIQSKR
jgi:hypothetical protein